MTEYEERGKEIRALSKSLVLHFMNAKPECNPSREGLKQAQIFRDCGFDWGEHTNSTSSQQQYWVVALLRELEEEDKVKRVSESGPWCLKKSI